MGGWNNSITFSVENLSSWKQIRNYWFLSAENTQSIFHHGFRSFPYQDFAVQYVQGKDIPMVDALSHVTPLIEGENDGIHLPLIAINEVTGKIPLPSIQLQEIQQETKKDLQLHLLMQYITNGWPEVHQKLPSELWNYWNYRDEFSMEQGIILKNHHIIVPETLWRTFLELVHEGHQGMST